MLHRIQSTLESLISILEIGLNRNLHLALNEITIYLFFVMKKFKFNNFVFFWFQIFFWTSLIRIIMYNHILHNNVVFYRGKMPHVLSKNYGGILLHFGIKPNHF